MEQEEKRLFYIPGDFTPARYQHHSRELLLKKYLYPKYDENKRMGFPTLADGYSKEPDKSSIYQYPPLGDIDHDKANEMWSEKCHYKSVYIPKELECSCADPKPETSCKKEERKKSSKLKRIPSTFINAMKNFELAKKLHRENLEHHPLPEVITDAMYQKLQFQRAKEPGLALQDDKFASAVAWKEYGGYAPTRCSKLKIFRPKTGIDKRVIENINERPCSVSSFDKRWRFIKKTKVSPMDLAICWDMLPVNPWDEPKRDTHIDGSNGSSAPAVFQLVHNPQNHKPPGGCCHHDRRPQTTASVPCKKMSSDVVPRVQSAYYEREERRYQSCPCLGKCNRENPVDHINERNTYYRSRRCGACQLKNIETKERKKRSEYKMALKAGVPNNHRSDIDQIVAARKYYTPMKPQTPYKNKNYTIESLDHPFAFQKTLKRRDYPEHWRLATIYQQSYKSPELRNLTKNN